MKICILNSVHPFSDTRVKRVAETLSEAGHKITIIAPASGEGGQEVFEARHQISTVEIRHAVRGDFSVGRRLGEILKTILSRLQVSFDLFRLGLKTRADVYHCNEMDSWIVAIFLKPLTRSQVVFDVHEYYPARLAEAAPRGLMRQLVEGLVSCTFSVFSRFSDGLIFVNDSVVGLYKFHGDHIILRNCVRLSDFRTLPEDEALQKEFQDRMVVVHIGSLREGYGPGALLESLAHITDPQPLFLILGGAPEGFLQETVNRGYANRVKVIDQLPLKEMLAYLSLAEIGITLLQPRDKNMVFSLGRKFLEYIAAGIPVVAPDFPEYRSIIDRYQLGLVMDPEDPREIAAAVSRLVADPDLRQRLGDNAARAFEEELNWEQESRKLLAFYQNLDSLTIKQAD